MVNKCGTLLVLLAMAIGAQAQNDTEYRMEIGGGIGLVAYEGDFNGNPLSHQQPMLTLISRYKLNPRMHIAANVSWGRIKSEASNAHTYYPSLEKQEFSASLLDIGLRYEYNFWPYGTGREYRGAKRLTPYIYIGAGVTMAHPDRTTMAANMPIGGGLKYKVAERTNLAIEWTAHFTTSDRLDGIADPYGIKSSGLFKNTDGYSHLRLTLTYDLWKKCKTCNNDI